MWEEVLMLVLKDVTLPRPWYFILWNIQKNKWVILYLFYYFVWGYNLITVLFYPEVDFVEIWELKNPKGFQGFIFKFPFIHRWLQGSIFCSAYLLILKFRKLLSFCSPSSIFFVSPTLCKEARSVTGRCDF